MQPVSKVSNWSLLSSSTICLVSWKDMIFCRIPNFLEPKHQILLVNGVVLTKTAFQMNALEWNKFLWIWLRFKHDLLIYYCVDEYFIWKRWKILILWFWKMIYFVFKYYWKVILTMEKGATAGEARKITSNSTNILSRNILATKTKEWHRE